MAKRISKKDESTIKKRVAQGLSYREAMKGTDVKSTRTVSRIVEKAGGKQVMETAETEGNTIPSLRKKYVALVERIGGREKKTAKVLVNMLSATKLFGKNGIEHPDWKARFDAIKYINDLRGMTVEVQAPQGNQFNFFQFGEKEQVDFNTKFTEFLKSRV